MAEVILFDLAGKIISFLGSHALNQIGLSFFAKKELTKLENKITTIRNVLLHAQEQQTINATVKEWLQRLKIILYEADDLFDEVATDALRKDLTSNKSKTGKVRYFFTSSNPAYFHYNLGRKIKNIRERIDEICTDMKDFEFVVRTLDKPINKKKEGTTSFVDGQKISGRETDKNALLQLIFSSHDHDEKVHVIPIVGMGGLGKTTLAQMVFNDDEVKNGFAKKMWVCVSDDFDMKRILSDILTSVGANVKNGGMEELQISFRKNLSSKKFFIVLDDVWNDDPVEWKKLEELLMTGAPGSRVLVTTRDRKVAKIVRTMDPYMLKGLHENECLSILLQWAFEKGEETKHPDLIEIGREIVKKCGGVPLAARSLGVLLYSKTSQSEWLLVRDNEMWAQVQNENDVIPILKLSYDQMPSSLKECFSYCSIFHKDKIIYKEQLMYHWIAHGLIQSTNANIQLEDICEHYLDELVRRSFLEYIIPVNGSLRHFKMHDLVHDLAVYMAGGESLFVKGDSTSVTSDRVRHVSFSLSSNFPRSLIEKQKLRTMMRQEVTYRDHRISTSVEEAISSSKSLRILDYGSGREYYDFPKSVEKLKHLRYLRYNSVSDIPKSLSELLNLQFLDVYFSDLDEQPEVFTNLINLRVLKFKTKLTCLPESIGNLTSLHTLVITDCRNLQSLGTGLRCISSLEHLKICNSHNYFEFSSSDFQGFTSLKYLGLGSIPRMKQLPVGLLDTAATLKHLRIDNCFDLSLTEDVLPNLLSLEALEIYYCRTITSLPEGMQRLNKLSHLEISHCDSLRDRCKPTGEDWPKISHVPRIRLNEKELKST